jgi:hypothetical protein
LNWPGDAHTFPASKKVLRYSAWLMRMPISADDTKYEAPNASTVVALLPLARGSKPAGVTENSS